MGEKLDRIARHLNGLITSYEAGAAARAAKCTRDPRKQADREYEAKVLRRQAEHLRKR